jgi:pyridoxal phosphate enzyme (YggS family)
MAFQSTVYQKLISELNTSGVTLIAVSKTKPVEDILQAYQEGVRDFGENYVQELTEKQSQLPADIKWHFIGHLQTNKVKYLAPFVYLIHGVDSEKLLTEINKQGKRNNRTINCLLQVHIAKEETKFGFDETELMELVGRLKENPSSFDHVCICGLMGMASFTDNPKIVEEEFRTLRLIFDRLKSTATTSINFSVLSMGMSSDYRAAIAQGSNMVRIGSMLFGSRS